MAAGDDVKKEIETFKRQSLKEVETNEKNVKPNAEGMSTILMLLDPYSAKLIIAD